MHLRSVPTNWTSDLVVITIPLNIPKIRETIRGRSWTFSLVLVSKDRRNTPVFLWELYDEKVASMGTFGLHRVLIFL